MKREPRNNQLRYRDGRPPLGGVSGRWGANGTGGLSPADRPRPVHAGLPAGETEEVGLTLTPPSRYRSLLVPLDGSPFGEHALPLALGIARRAGAHVRLVHVHSRLESSFDQGSLRYDSGLDIWLRRRQEAYLDGLVRRLAKVTSVRVTPLLMDGREVATSLREAASAATDLVVMATHGRGPLGRLWHGGVADVLVRNLTAPLLLTRGYDSPVDLTGDPAPRHVLVPLDGAEAAEQALGPALDLGTLAGADHTLLRVLRLEPDYSVAYGRVGSQRTAGERAQAEAWDYLRRVALRLGGEAARIDPRLLVAEQPTAASILWYAQRHDADLIALTTRGRGPLSRLFRGSVADQVARRSTTPVLLVRTAE
jgi:nucleotide-binding universal stress UspA family protein